VPDIKMSVVYWQDAFHHFIEENDMPDPRQAGYRLAFGWCDAVFGE
jgi:hypothetical protein